MSIKESIDRIFHGKAFAMPLFYSYPGGLRFELSESGSPLDQVLLALDKARLICGDVFDSQDSLVVCFRERFAASRFAHRAALRELKKAGISIPSERAIWLERVDEGDWFDADIEEWWLYVAFEASVALVPNLLWCAFSSDFSCIRPRPGCITYLFNLKRKVMVFPYDDRGMDIVGPNHDLLASIFIKHRRFLLDYDMEEMLETFENNDHKL